MTELIIKVDDDFLRKAKLKGMEEQFELVRCKDCVNNPKGIGWIACPMTGANTRKPDDFCSYGERGNSDDE